jgi:hypothetical protein
VDQTISFNKNVLIVQCGKEGQPLRNDLKTLAEKYSRAELVQAVEEPFWREIKRYYGKADNLFNVSLNWMNDRS